MKEYYNLPVRFSEEEREAYAAWGIKKEKTLMPYAVVILCFDLFLMGCEVLFLLGLAQQKGGFYANVVASGRWLASLGEIAMLVLIGLTIKPVDMLLDRLYKRPAGSRMLRLEPREVGVTYKLSQGKKVLTSGILLWDEWEKAVDAGSNRIWIPDEWLNIGLNTVETIYPKEKQHSWMDSPEEKIVGTIRLEEIQRCMRGYLASLEEKKREEEWLRQNGPV